MKNMKRSSEQYSAPQAMPASKEEYPYGLRLHLSEEDLKKLGISLPEVGSKMKLKAVVEVCDISTNESKMYGENRSMSLQITDMELSGSVKSDGDGD